MKISKDQALILIDKFNLVFSEDLLDKDLNHKKYIDYSISCGVVYRIEYKSANIRLSIARENNKLLLKLLSPHGQINGEYKMPRGIFKIFNRPWRQWIKLKTVIEIYDDEIAIREERAKVKAQKESFNHVIYSTYPDELNKIILGGDDDT